MQIRDLPSSGSLAATDVLAKDASGGTTEKINGSDLASSVKTLGSLLGTSDVVNNLTIGETKPVSSGAVASALASGSINATSWLADTGGGATLIYIGKLAILYVMTSLKARSEGDTILTIPSQYRPASGGGDFVGQNGNVPNVIRINSNGTVTTWILSNTSTSRIYVTMIYVMS